MIPVLHLVFVIWVNFFQFLCSVKKDGVKQGKRKLNRKWKWYF